MKALVLESAGRLVLKDCPKPVPRDGEVLVRTKAATICTSDINDINYNPFGIELPMIMGHEGAGIIESVGNGVTDYIAGDEIAAHPVMPCGECASCKRGLPHLCDDMTHLGINHGGVFAEYFTIRADKIRKKPADISFAAASLMEPVCVCIEAVKRANVAEGSNTLIIGDGSFGIMIANICESMWEAEYAGVDICPHAWLTDLLTAASLHINAALPRSLFLEYNVSDNCMLRDIVKNPVQMDRYGMMEVPQGARLGIEIDESAVKRYSINL